MNGRQNLYGIDYWDILCNYDVNIIDGSLTIIEPPIEEDDIVENEDKEKEEKKK